MDKDEKIIERQQHNAPFLAAFKYMMNELDVSQKDLAAKIGINAPLISQYKRGTKKVSKNTMAELCCISKGRLNLNYMLGLSNYMMLENVPDNEILTWIEKENNPDYDVMQKSKKLDEQPVDHSSVINAMLAAKDETIAAKDETIASLKEQLKAMEKELAAKDETIALLRQQVVIYQSKNRVLFPSMVAEDKNFEEVK